MTLHDVVELLPLLNEELTIYALSPWSPASPAITAIEPESGGLPDAARQQALEYFIEVFVAREFLDGWLENLGREATTNERCQRLIQYAQNDA